MKRMKTALIAAVLLGVLAAGAAAASGIQQILVDLRPDITVEVDGMARTMTDKNGKTVYSISYDGTTYHYSIDTIGTEEDTALKCHYVNVRILFEVLNVK